MSQILIDGLISQNLFKLVSIVKMDILPRIHFFLSMLPLSPPTDYWDKIHSLVSKFIWLTTLQCHKRDGGLSVPNFRHYFLSFILRPLADWLNPDSVTFWKPIAITHRLEDLIYSAVPLKQAKLRLSPIMSYLLSIWRLAEKE